MSDAPATQDGKMTLTITHSKAAAPDVKVAVKKVSQFRKVFAAAAERFGTTPDALIFKFNEKVLEGDQTPKMHEIPDGGVITAYPADEDEDMGTQQTNDGMDEIPDAGANDEEPQSAPASKSDKVTLIIRSQEGPSFQLKVARTKPLKAAFDKAHEQFKKPLGTFRFFYNGTRLRDEETPKMHEMDNEDEIDAQLQQVGGSHIA